MILCCECLEWVEPYDGGEANDCALSICPNCGFWFDADDCPEEDDDDTLFLCDTGQHAFEAVIDPDDMYVKCSRCGLIKHD